MKALAILIVFISVSGSAIEAGQGTTGTGDLIRNTVLEPVQNQRYEYYEICGCSEKDLQCDLSVKAIRCDDGKKYDSVTNWKITWKYSYHRAANSCATTAFTAIVDITFRLPNWARDSKATQQLSDKWDRYIQNILVHEQGHRDRAIAAAVELTRSIADLPPARTCSGLDREVDRIARGRLAKLLEEQTEYDKATNHGRSQGVFFP